MMSIQKSSKATQRKMLMNMKTSGATAQHFGVTVRCIRMNISPSSRAAMNLITLHTTIKEG